MNRKKCIFGFLILSIVTSACGFLQVKRLTEQDIVGVWKQDSQECKDSLPNCAQFEFTEDGKFTANNIPEKYFGYGINVYLSKGSFTATGEWNIEVNPDPLGWNKINLMFDPVTVMNYPAYENVIYILGGKGNYHLWSFIDPDSDGIEFTHASTNSDNK